jgi:hypothetical protein
LTFIGLLLQSRRVTAPVPFAQRALFISPVRAFQWWAVLGSNQ